ncbi:MAG TPA: Fe-S-containing protein [Blastocatellia bacterium]|nr:Fe-S-containing protein [Blastocatellia bacterium]
MQNQSQSREKKREQFVTDAKAKSKATPILIAVLIVGIAVAAYVVISSSDKPEAITVTSSAPKANPNASLATTSNNPQAINSQGEVIQIPLADLSAQAKFFNYSGGGKTVRFFVVQSNDGKYRAALDACETCFAAKKGYIQQGDQMICQKCKLPFAIANIGEAQGGCHPIGLPSAVEGNQLVIKASEVANRASYF